MFVIARPCCAKKELAHATKVFVCWRSQGASLSILRAPRRGLPSSSGARAAASLSSLSPTFSLPPQGGRPDCALT